MICAQGGTTQEIFAKFGRGKAGSLLALGRLVLSQTAMWLYGGLIRDLVLRNEVHDGMDLDVGLPSSGLDALSGVSSLAQLAANAGLAFVRRESLDPRVVKAFFKTADASQEIEVQVAICAPPTLPCCACCLLA